MHTVLVIEATWGREILWPKWSPVWCAFVKKFDALPGPFRHRVVVPAPIQSEDEAFSGWESVDDRRKMHTLFGGVWREFGWCIAWEAVKENMR